MYSLNIHLLLTSTIYPPFASRDTGNVYFVALFTVLINNNKDFHGGVFHSNMAVWTLPHRSEIWLCLRKANEWIDPGKRRRNKCHYPPWIERTAEIISVVVIKEHKWVTHALRAEGIHSLPNWFHYNYMEPSGKVDPLPPWQLQGMRQNMETGLRHGGHLRAGFCPARLKTLVPMLTWFDDVTLKMYSCQTGDVRMSYLLWFFELFCMYFLVCFLLLFTFLFLLSHRIVSLKSCRVNL